MIAEENRCRSCAQYCGEQIRCEDSAERCRGDHCGIGRYGRILWSRDRRPQPAVMYEGLCMGHRYGSYEADANMLAAAQMQDAANRIEFAMKQGKLT